ncbi:DNA damage-inducible transcript 4-like protein [Pholidichthys leucotaenia]
MVYTAALVLAHHGLLAPEEDRAPGMTGKYRLRLTAPSASTGTARRGSVDSCDDSDYPACQSLGACLEHLEQPLQQEVTQQLEHCLTEAKATVLDCQLLLLPRHMTARVGQDVLRISADEPCGIRGASIKIYAESKGGLKSVGTISPDSSVTPTFELSAVFKVDDGGWPPLKHIFGASKMLKLKPEYRLVKRKLYSSASPVVHDFN